MFIVRIEFQRVQTFLFTVPRLRDMVGANVLLGEMIRCLLPRLAQGCNSKMNDFAVQPPDVDPADPLQVAPKDEQDNPKRLYERGILSRDGGHFQAVFESDKDALNFEREVRKKIWQELPRLRFEVINENIEIENEKIRRRLREEKDDTCNQPNCRDAEIIQIVDLPQFQVCEESGNGPAIGRFPYSPEPENQRLWISQSVYERKEKARQFFRDKVPNKESTVEPTKDIIGLLQKELPLFQKMAPQDFHELCEDDYMAVIHADGNEVGKRSKEYRDNFYVKYKVDSSRDDLYLNQEAYGEQFFHRMRVAVRKSVVAALYKAFCGHCGQFRPYQLLMLGGDDLLLVCQAKYALPFLVHYAKELLKHELPDGNTLNIGVGITISSPSLPFYRLHSIAEDLAGSAKKLTRRESVVDWTVITSSWCEDPIQIRERDMHVKYQTDKQETLVLTGRPYRILKNGKNDLESLECLLDAASEISRNDKEDIARSQLKNLSFQLAKGKRWTELCFRELPSPTKGALMKSMEIKPSDLWKDINGLWQTQLNDLVEIFEIRKLGHRTSRNRRGE
ncbi:MAG: hypothetical protein C4527_01655 [Candidatus Omnitrophota bacterium]|jgi:hypothetical protein|nr:MAG: hypothetical protein C4527_01655 [Candidatus Omnitrophota bacterium]